MAKRVVWPSDEELLALAQVSLNINDIADAFDISRPTFYAFLGKNQELKNKVKAILRETRPSTKGKPDCEEGDCTRPVHARSKCKKHYELWLSTADPADKIQKHTYPTNQEIIDLFKRYYRLSDVARHIGVQRETFRDYIECRPDILEAIKDYRALPEEVKDQRNRDAHLRWKNNNRDKVREINSRWAKNRDPNEVRKVNKYNRERRASQRVEPRSVEEALLTVEYTSIILNDPCVYCGGPSESIDHIDSINKGGIDSWENYAPSCRSCNSSKRDKSLLSFLDWRLDHV